MSVHDLRPLFTERSAAQVRPGLAMVPVAEAPRLALDADAAGLLRDGLGTFDMEIRWLAHLDDTATLRLWRSWTGFQVYEARVITARLTGLKVEQHPDRHTGKLSDEPMQFERVLIRVVNDLRRFRAGHTPYGPSPAAGPLPDPWP
ncbi:hypothetical protein [Dactylosporangium salmoneum]|uniref:Uncharacterized protein n=1 Tax=Dactylosporangium salmoneum TaxID=53361 RepID=A0ABP5VC82_9ACTN